MPITDNSFTSDELDAVLTAKPELISEISKIAEKRGGYFAPDKTAKDTYEGNLAVHTKTALTLEHATMLEKDVEEITGVKKLPQEKYFDYNKRVLKMQTESSKSASSELALLKGKSDITQAERDRIKELENLQTSWTAEKTNLTNTHQTEVTQLKAENKIFSQIGKIDAKLKKTPELQEAISIVREKVIEDMKRSAKFQDDKMVFFGLDGKAMMNTDASFKTAEQVYAERMDKYIDKAKTQGGAGGNGDGNPEVIPAGNLKSQYEVDKFLQSKGFVFGTKEFSSEQEKLGRSKLPLR